MNNKIEPSKIIISFNDYKNMDIVYDKVAGVIRTLLETNHIILSYNLLGDTDCVVLEYIPNIPDAPKPFWETEEEAVELQIYKSKKELKECKNKIKELSAFEDLDKYKNGGGFDA